MYGSVGGGRLGWVGGYVRIGDIAGGVIMVCVCVCGGGMYV